MSLGKISVCVSLLSSIGVCQSALAAPYVTDQAQAKGFVEDSSLNVLLRNYYFNRDRNNGGNDYRDWSQGIQGVFSSGFTQGTLGVGIDGYGYSGIKLWAPDKYVGSGALVIDSKSDGTLHAEDAYGKAGAAVKFRVSKTELRIGDMKPVNSPVFAVGGLRLTPQTATGINVMSSEVEGLDLEGGHFWSGSSETTTAHDGELWASYAFVTSKSIDYFGGRYKVDDNWQFSLYSSKLEDVWDQYYINNNYNIPINSSDSFNIDFNLYRTLDEGQAKAGSINNTVFSLATAYTFRGAHTFTLGFQKVNGDTPYDYVGFGDGRGSDSIYLGNSAQYSDYNGPNEKSWRLQYDLNFATLGVPGLTFNTRYVWGYDIDGTGASSNSAYRYADGTPFYGADGKHHEIDAAVKYVIQSGFAKNLSMQVRGVVHSANRDQPDGDIKQVRIITEYPFSIF